MTQQNIRQTVVNTDICLFCLELACKNTVCMCVNLLCEASVRKCSWHICTDTAENVY